MNNDLFATALGLAEPWFVDGLTFSEAKRRLTLRIDFRKGSRFAQPGEGAEHPVHDTRIKRYQHLNFFQHQCLLEVRVPRVKLPNGQVALIEPSWAGKLSGFTLLFEALVMAFCREMPFAAVARLTGLSWHKVHAICTRYVDLARAQADLSGVEALAIDETSRAKGHDYVTVFADAQQRSVIGVQEGRRAQTVGRFAEHLARHGGEPANIHSVSIDMSPAYIKGVAEHLPNAQVTFDKFHVIAHASKALDATRRMEQRGDPTLKGLRWTLLKDRRKLNPAQRAGLNALLANMAGKRTARA